MTVAPAENERLNLTEILLGIFQENKSGVLRFEYGNVKKQLIIREGHLAFAESSVPGEHLAILLVKTKRLSRFDLRRITEVMKEGKTTDEALLSASKLTRASLEEGAREQAVFILSSLFSWEYCEVRFYPGTSLTRRGLNLGIPLPELLVLAARRAATERKLPPSLAKMEGTVVQVQTGASMLHLPLDNLQAYVYSIAQDPVPLERFLQLIPPGGIKPEDLLTQLLLLGLLRLEKREMPGPAGGTLGQQAELRHLQERVGRLLIQFEVADHYEILAVPTNADEQVIKDAYHILAREFHPDRFQTADYTPAFRSQAQKLFTYITGAYTVLSDPASRASYDDRRLKEGSKIDAAQAARAGVDLEKERMAEALYRMGRIEFSKGEIEQAVNHLREAVWTRPDVARYQLHLGIAQSATAKYRKDAETHLLKAVELDPMSVDSRMALAKLYVKVDLPRRAESQLHEVLHWIPDHREAKKMLESLSPEKGEGGFLRKLKRPAPS